MNPICGQEFGSREPRQPCTTRSACEARTPCLTVWVKSADRVIRYRAGSTGARPGRSGSQRTTALAAPPRHDGTTGTGTHTQPEAVDPGPAPVVRLEGALALGHRCSPRPLAVTVPIRPVHSGIRTAAFQSSLPNRRGPGGPVAAVSPTFGRLFEGTEVSSAGQTAPVDTPKPRPPSLLANCWHRAGNLLASGRAGTPAKRSPVTVR